MTVVLPLVGPSRNRGSALLTVAAALLAAGGAAYSGLMVGEGNKSAVVLPLAAGVALILGVIAVTRFGAYVFLMLLLRSSIDLAKLSGEQTGNTAANTATARGLDPSSILAMIFLVAAVLWLAAQYQAAGGRLPGSSLRRALGVFGIAVVLSVIGSERFSVSVMEGLRIISVVVMFVVLEQMMRDRKATKRILLAVFLSLAAPLLYTVGGYLVGAPPTEDAGGFARVTGTFWQSNTFGRYLMVMIVFGVALYPHLRKRVRYVMAPTLALSSVFLVLTYTRTALLGAVIGLVVVGALQSKRVLAGLAVVGVAALIFVPQMASRFGDLTATEAGPASAPTGNTLDWRLSYWHEVLPLANESPITGIGLNMTQYRTEAAKQPHSDFVRAYVETGLIGLGAYVVLLVTLLTTGRRAVRVAPPNSVDRGIAVGFLGCATAFVAVSLAANVMSNVVTLWYLVAFAAAATGVIHRATDTAPSAVTVPGPRPGS